MTEQLAFWTGNFGNGYMARNSATPATISKLIKSWSKILQAIPANSLSSILEIGCNIGLNLRALKLIFNASFYGVEPFAPALEQCQQDQVLTLKNSFLSSIFNLEMFADNQIDLVFTSGVLIHICLEDLKQGTDNIVRIAKKYILCIEYFADKEEQIIYRGHKNVLFKRDFGAFYLDNYANLTLKDYGFFWKRDIGIDNSHWWLFEKS